MKHKILLLWLMLLVGASGLRAAEAYAYLSLNHKTLIFYNDNNRSSRNYAAYTYDLDYFFFPGWHEYASEVTEVLFDTSFISARPTTCDFWFSGMNNLTSISGWFYLDTSSVTDMAFMFEGCSSLTSLSVSMFNTEHVTNMNSMFKGCSSLTSLYLSNFDTSNVTNMESMFQGCSSLSSLDVSNFRTNDVKNMASMFSGCSNLSSLDVSNFSTWRVENMSYMFYNCENLTSIDVSGLDIWSVETMERMFYGCKKLSILDLSSLYFSPGPNSDVSSNECYKEMLGNCTGLKTLIVPASANNLYNNSCIGVGTQSAPCTLFYPDGFTPETTETGDGWYKWKSGYFKDVEPEPYAVIYDTTLKFYYDTKRISRSNNYTIYDLNTGSTSPAWRNDAASVTNVVFDPTFANARPTSCHSWFNGMQDLTSISGLNYLNTSQVTDMVAMFTNCWSLTSLDPSGFNTVNVTDMSFMFYGCYDLNNINLSSFNTNNVTNMSYMFQDCQKLESLNVSGFNTANVTDMGYMFNGCSKLSSLDVSGFNTANVTTMVYMFSGCTNLESLDVSGFNTINVTTMSYMFKNCSKLSNLDLSSFTFNSGLSSFGLLQNAIELKTLIIPATAVNLRDNACSGVGTQSTPCALIYPDGFTPETTATGDGWYQWRGGYFKDVVPEPYAVLSTDNKTLTFYYDKLRTLRTGTTYNLNTVNNTPGWYSKRASVTNVVFDPSFADARPTSCYCWFSQMTNLESISGMNYLNTSSVTNMRNMFSKCTQLATIDVSHFNTSQVVDMSGMFARCAFTTIDVSKFDTSNVTNMMGMFSNCTQLSTIDVSHFNTAQVVDMSGMFEQCAFTTIDVSNFNTSNVTNMKGMFVNDASLESLDISNFVIPDSTSYSGYGTSMMFANCSNLKTLVVPMTAKNIKHGSCTGVGTYYAPCALIYPDGFTPETTATGNGWYQWKSGYFKDAVLKPYAVLDSTTLTFYYDTCSNSREGTVYNMNTGNTSPGWYEYEYDYVSVKNVLFDPSFANARPTSCYRWFDGMSELTSITGIKYFNTSNVTSMANMFNGCTNLANLDVSGFNTKNVTNMQYMFRGCSSLTNLDVSGFDTGNVTSMALMFSGCTNLTSLDVSGFDTGKVTDMSDMFSSCSSLTSLDVSGFDTGNVTSMYSMFSSCSSLTSLDVSGFDTGEVTKMAYMFSSCSGLASLDVSGFDTGNVTSMYYMFSSCSGLTSLDVSGFNTGNVTKMTYMFANCSGLTSLDLSKFNTSNVTDIAYMFNNCTALISLDLSGFTFKSGVITNNMLRNCTGLQTLSIPETASNLKNTACTGVGTQTAPCTLFYPDGFDLVKDAEGDGWYQWKSGYFKDAVLEPYAVLDGTTLTFYYDKLRSLRTGTTYDLNTGTSLPGWYGNHSAVTNVVFDPSFADALPTSCCRWFFEMTNLTSIAGMENLNTSSVTNMMGMFSNCTQLSTIDVSHFNTSQVEDMSGMFEKCAIATIDVSNFDTSNVINMMGMFINDTSLESLDISNFVIPDSTSYYGYGTSMMFINCSNLKTLGVPMTAQNIKHGSCEGVGTQDAPCTLVYLDGFTLETTATGDGWYKWKKGYFKDAEPEPYAIFHGTTLTFVYDKWRFIIDDETFGMEPGLLGWPKWISKASAIENVVFDPSFAEVRPTSCAHWFGYMTQATDIVNLCYLNTSEVANMAEMFLNCSSLTSLDVSSFNTANVTNMRSMFSGCSSLTSLDLSNFNTVNVTTMEYMFYACSSLTNLNVGGSFNTANVTNMHMMFCNCSSLTSLDLSGFNTEKVTNMSGMFQNCSSLTSVNVSGFNTASVMYMGSMFDNCSSLTSLDLSSFTLPLNNYWSTMMKNCTSLQTLTVPATAGNLPAGACEGVGTQEAPCTLIYPSDFTPEPTATGDGWYQWKSGYFKDRAFLMADVNHDGEVTILDVTLLVDYLLSKNPSSFYTENADVNNDQEITITDVTAMVNILLHQSASHAPATAREATMDRLWLTADGSHCLLHLDTPEHYTAMHLTLRLPEGGSMGNMRLSSSRSAGHGVSMQSMGDGLYNVVLCASDNAELRSDATELLHFDLVGCQPQDVEVVAVQSTNRLYETVMSGDTTTGLEVVETDDATDGDGYNTVGVRVGKNTRGVVIKNGGKTVRH